MLSLFSATKLSLFLTKLVHFLSEFLSDTDHYCFHRGSQNKPHKLDPTDRNSIYDAPFVDGAPVKILIHGYTGYVDYSPNMELRPGEKLYTRLLTTFVLYFVCVFL